MSMTLVAGLSSNLALKLPLPLPNTISSSRLSARLQNQVPFSHSLVKTQSLWHNPKKYYNRFLISRKLENFPISAGDAVDGAHNDERGESTMPERFRYLSKEAPDPPLRWPFFVALGFILYAWRAVLFELANWRKGVLAIFRLVGYLFKCMLAIIFYFLGNPITSTIRAFETAFYTIRSFYSAIVAYAPVPELTTVIILASAVLAVSEASVPDSVSSQPYLLTLSALSGYTAVRGYISEPLFWTILLCLYSFSRFIKKRDDVTSALPAAVVLAAVGEPWVRIMALGSFLGVAISHHWMKLSKGNGVEVGEAVNQRSVPLPLMAVALAIGIHAAAKWAGYRHLTWMIL